MSDPDDRAAAARHAEDQREIARIALHLPSARGLALAGGGAVVANGMVDRPTGDVDLFTADPAEIPRVGRELVAELTARGYAVAVDTDLPQFVRLSVTPPDSRDDPIGVEVGRDHRMRPAVELAVGRVLHPEEAAANKAVALFSRAAARDLVDVDALAGRYGRERLLELGAEKDLGFNRAVFATGLGVGAARPDREFYDLGLTPAQLDGLRQRALAWRAELLAEPHSAGTDLGAGRAGTLSDAERDQLRRLRAADFGPAETPARADPAPAPVSGAEPRPPQRPAPGRGSGYEGR